MAEGDKAKLWEHSRPCQEIDYFMSHTWWTPGWLKYVSLVLRSGRTYGAVGGLLVLMVTFVLTLAGALPSEHVYKTSILGWEGEVLIGPWCPIVGPLAGLVCIINSPALPSLWRQPIVFLDWLCINQMDPLIRDEGIHSLGGFLAHSRELHILWSRPYFGRLWCIFEIAAFRSHRKDGKIIFFPLFQDLAELTAYLCVWLAVIALYLAIASGVHQHSLYLAIASGVASASIGPMLAISTLRRLMHEKIQLKQELHDFDATKASCREESDRAFIFKNIDAWFGGVTNFNSEVRGSLGAEVVQSMRRSRLSYRSAICVSFPTLCLVLSFVAGFWSVYGQRILHSYEKLSHKAGLLGLTGSPNCNSWWALGLQTRVLEKLWTSKLLPGGV